jgi:hypothetical protein
MKRLAVILLLFATPAFAQRQDFTSIITWQVQHSDDAQKTCTGTSSTVLTGNNMRQSVTVRNIGTGDVYLCATDHLATGATPTACTTATAGVYLGGTAKDAYTYDKGLYEWGLSCITASGTATILVQEERQQ